MNHIAFVIPGLDRIGGAESQTIALAHGLKRRGWTVTVVALSGTGVDTASSFAANGIHFLTLEMRKGLADPRGWLRFNRWLRRAEPDVVHAHLPHAVWLARWSRLTAPIRVVVDTLHSSSTGTWGRKAGYRTSDWLTNQVSAVSEAVAQSHRSAGMVSESKLIIVPNGIDADEWRPDPEVRRSVRREFNLGDEFLWLAAGRLEPVKDYPTLLRAMTHIPEPSRLLIAGAGYLEAELRQMSTKLGLDGRVRFLGFTPGVRRWMQAADGFVLSSLWEGLPVSLLEAGACALPAVATNVAGTREVLLDGHTGLLVPPADPATLGETMTRLMRVPMEQRMAMGRNARKSILDRFNMEAVLDRWEEVYADLLQSNPKPKRKA